MRTTSSIRLIRVGIARALTRGGADYGVEELDGTRIRPLG